MQNRHSDRSIDLEARSLDEQDRRIVSATGDETIELDKLADTVRIERPPRAHADSREMLSQQWLAE